MKEIEMLYFGSVDESGIMKIRDRKGFDKYVSLFRGKDVEILVRRKKSRRSVEQNALWWVYMTILSKDIGYTKDEIHEICKFKFLQKEKVDEKTGEIFKYLGSTAKLSKVEFMDLVAELQQWSVETFGIVLPSPDEQIKIFA